MAKVLPFKGIRYNQKIFSDLSQVTAPPYDVISPQGQKLYYDKHPDNIIRLILGMEYPEDSTAENKYTRAKNFFYSWLKNNILVYEDQPSIYFYTQEYKLKDNSSVKVRHGFISLVKLEDFSQGIICPHEQTLSAPKKDRLELMRNCEANFSQIFGLYEDKSFIMENELSHIYKNEPTINIVDHEGTVNKLWKISDTETINKITILMSKKTIVIADGHHRYETALNYRNERKENNPNHTGNEPYNYVMFMLVNIDDPGLIILPTHRLIHNLPEINIAMFLEKLSEFFIVTRLKTEDNPESTIINRMEEIGKNKHVFGLYTEKNEYYLLVLKDDKALERYSDHSKSKAWKELDVAILHNLIIEQFLDINHHHLKDGKHIVYNHNFNECVEKIKNKEFQLVLFLNPTRSNQVMEISGHGELMPQKSTYFYPKLLSGLVINRLQIFI